MLCSINRRLLGEKPKDRPGTTCAPLFLMPGHASGSRVHEQMLSSLTGFEQTAYYHSRRIFGWREERCRVYSILSVRREEINRRGRRGSQRKSNIRLEVAACYP